MLKMPGADRPAAEQVREMMERQVQHLVRLVDDLLDVSRIMRGKIELRQERVDLADGRRPGGRDGPAARSTPSGHELTRRAAGRTAAAWRPTRCGWPRWSATC